MPLRLPGPGQAVPKACGQLKAGQFAGAGWTWVHHCMATLRQMGTVTIPSGLVGSSVCQLPPRGWNGPAGLPTTGQWGAEGTSGARWAPRVPCRGQEGCSSEQQVEIAAGKGSGPGIVQQQV